jgi:hypothetical protein
MRTVDGGADEVDPRVQSKDQRLCSKAFGSGKDCGDASAVGHLGRSRETGGRSGAQSCRCSGPVRLPLVPAANDWMPPFVPCAELSPESGCIDNSNSLVVSIVT